MKAVIVTVPDMIEPADYADLAARMDAVDYVERDSISEAELAEVASGYDYLLLNYDVVKSLSAEFYDAVRGTSLKGISTEITGMDWANPQEAAARGIALMYLPDYCTDSIAEQVIAEALLHARKMVAELEDLRRGDKPAQRLSRNLRGRTLGAIGLGFIGTRTVEMASCIGMKVVGWNRTTKIIPGCEIVDSPEEVLQRSEFLTLGLKTTHETEGFLSAERIGRLQSGVVVLNLASRKLADNDAVIDALRDGRIAGYSVGRSSATEEAFRDVAGVRLVSSTAWYSEESVRNLRRKWVHHVVDHMDGKSVPIAS